MVCSENEKKATAVINLSMSYESATRLEYVLDAYENEFAGTDKIHTTFAVELGKFLSQAKKLQAGG